MVNNGGIKLDGVNIIASGYAPIVQRLKGFVRNMLLDRIDKSVDKVCVYKISGEDHSNITMQK
jgi:hypothetical protein